MTRRQWLGFAALSAACVFSAVYGFVWWAAGKITRQPRIGGELPKRSYHDYVNTGMLTPDRPRSAP